MVSAGPVTLPTPDMVPTLPAAADPTIHIMAASCMRKTATAPKAVRAPVKNLPRMHSLGQSSPTNSKRQLTLVIGGVALPATIRVPSALSKVGL